MNGGFGPVSVIVYSLFFWRQLSKLVIIDVHRRVMESRGAPCNMHDGLDMEISSVLGGAWMDVFHRQPAFLVVSYTTVTRL